jgi:hypothetical protein
MSFHIAYVTKYLQQITQPIGAQYYIRALLMSSEIPVTVIANCCVYAQTFYELWPFMIIYLLTGLFIPDSFNDIFNNSTYTSIKGNGSMIN